MLDTAAGMSMSSAVDMLLNVDNNPPAPPLNHYSTAQNPDPNVPLGQPWVNAAFYPNVNFLGDTI